MNHKKIGIMGGTFDPIHIGHLVVANEVLNTYNLDKIIFVPAGKPPHKKGPYANCLHRYLMTNMATVSNEKFEVSDIEIKREGKSYTLETLEELMNRQENAELFFITGADAITELPNWHEPEKLLKLCKFIAVMRPGYDREYLEGKIEEFKEKYNCCIEILQAPMLQISSTDIRKRIKNNKVVKYLLPESVERYILKNNLYINDGLDDLDLEGIKTKLKSMIRPKLYEHSLRTMEEAENLAEYYNVDKEKAKIAALLHDCGKFKNESNDNLQHARLGAQIAEDKFNINDIDILNAIKHHTTGNENMSMLEKIIFLADKTEAGRNYKGIDKIRLLSYKDIDEAIIKSIEGTIDYIKERNLELDERSIRTINHLKGGKIDNRQ
jgi:nicotinate-nucleotide adenylyltransferase